eukprot:1155869-Pelagomonas_calceolata.AAC.3
MSDLAWALGSIGGLVGIRQLIVEASRKLHLLRVSAPHRPLLAPPYRETISYPTLFSGHGMVLRVMRYASWPLSA